MAPAKVRKALPYKDFLQPAFQRRFSAVVGIVLAISYLQAVWLNGFRHPLWSWFPLGPSGIYAVAIFTLGYSAIVILRIELFHVGSRTSKSGFDTLIKYAFRMHTLEALFAYTLSALVFGAFYIRFSRESSNLSWITYFTEGRARLNERPLYLTVYLVTLAVLKAVRQLAIDDHRLRPGQVQSRGGANEKAVERVSHAVSLQRLWEQVPTILGTVLGEALWSVPLSLAVYYLLLRHFLWWFLMSALRLFYPLPKTNMVPLQHPSGPSAILRAYSAGIILDLTWSVAGDGFSIFMTRPPLKDAKPLSSESRDPNGTLLKGLKSPKLIFKSFAMWELALIARDFESRRRIIYEDIDRLEGPVWSQIFVICIETIQTIETRIENYGKPATVAAPAFQQPAPEEKKRTTAPPKEDQILVVTPPRKGFRDEVVRGINKGVTSPGQKSQFSPVAKATVDAAKDTLKRIQAEVTGRNDSEGFAISKAKMMLRYWGLRLFQQHYHRRLNLAVFGEPYAEPSVYINAASALSLLASHSVSEDKFGNVQRDVAALIRIFTRVIAKLEKFRADVPTHWTEVEPKRKAHDVEAVIGALKEGLSLLIDEFGQWARDLRLSVTDLRLAREAAGLPDTCVEVFERKFG